MAGETIEKEHPWNWAIEYGTHQDLPRACSRGDLAWVSDDSTLLLCGQDGLWWALRGESQRELSLERLGCRPGESIMLPEGQVAVCTQAREWDICLTAQEQAVLAPGGGLLIAVVLVAVALIAFFGGRLWNVV